MKTVNKHWPIAIDAMVVMPDHLYALWTLPEDGSDYSTRWRPIKSGFSRNLASPSMRSVWQTRFWEHPIRDDDDYQRHVEYIWSNPAKHGHTERASDWSHSSLHRSVQQGLVPPDWGGSANSDQNQEHGYGE